MDQIRIKDLEVYCHHGIKKEENILGQKFLVSAVFYTDIKEAGKDDNIKASIDYSKVSYFIKEYMKEHTYRLIESVAEHLSAELLLAFPLIKKLCLTVKKPWAPILLPLDTVSVKVERGWYKSYLSIGSNIGNKEKHIQAAIKRLRADRKIKVLQCSQLIDTKPYGNTEQDMFLNGVIEIDTLYSPNELLEMLQETENIGGRVRAEKWGPRTIDIDILLYDNRVLSEENLIIPHPDMHNRIFVLEPLESIAPWALHPVFGETVSVLLSKCRAKK